MSTISIRILTEIFETLGALGHNVDGLHARIGLKPGQMDNHDTLVDVQVYFRCWDEAVRIAGPRLPLEVAKRSEATHNILRFVCMPCATVREALLKCCSFLAVITDLSAWSLKPVASGAVLSITRTNPAHDMHRFANEYAAADVVALGRLFAGTQWSPLGVCFPHAEPSNTSHLRAFLGSPIRFGGSGIHLELAHETLDLPLQRSNPSEAAFFETHVATMLRTPLGSEPSMYQGVYTFISRSQPARWPTLEQVAEGLKMSPRTLRRRLRSEQTSFQRVVDDCRFALAKEHIAAGKMSFTELAVELGFSEPSTFYRAFRRWSGTTPQQFDPERPSS